MKKEDYKMIGVCEKCNQKKELSQANWVVQQKKICQNCIWGSEKGYHYVCMTCDTTVPKVNHDGECERCAL
jgi:hypothetical protein